MTVETVTWRTGAPLYVPRSGGPADDSQPALADVHALGAHRAPAAFGQSREAQVAEQPSRIQLVQALAGQRRAPALCAAVASGRQRADAGAHHEGGEIGHAAFLRVAPVYSCKPAGAGVYANDCSDPGGPP